MRWNLLFLTPVFLVWQGCGNSAAQTGLGSDGGPDSHSETDSGGEAGSDTDGDADTVCDEIGARVFSQGTLHRADITLSEANWRAIRAQAEAYAADEDTPQTYFEASFRYDDGEKLDGVGIRIKGNHSVCNTVELGKSLPLKVDFNRFQPGQQLDGLKKLNLHSVVDDPEEWEWPSDPIADYVSYRTMRAHGAATSRATFVEVYVNGVSQGLYSVVEQVSGGFIKCNYPEPWGDLYKPGESLSYEGDSIDNYPHIGFKWPDKSDYQSVIGLIRALDEGSNAELEQVLDIDGALQYFALNIGLGNWDYYTFITHNYYLYEMSPGKFTLIPWDMNMSQVSWTEPCGVGAGGRDLPLSSRLLGDPDYVARYIDILKSFLEGAGAVSAQHAVIDEIAPLVQDWIPDGRLDDLKSNISIRVPGMLAALAGLTVCPDEIEWEE